MFTSTDFNTALDNARQQLESMAGKLSAITCPHVATLNINLRELTSAERIAALLEGVPNGYRKEGEANDYVYVIRIAAEQGGLLETLWGQLEQARGSANDYCSVNREHKGTHTLYVGRSKKLRSRLSQHLGSEHRGTYSMQLQRWATENNADISISYMKFENEDNLLVQAIEDSLWVSLRPAFGRKGDRRYI